MSDLSIIVVTYRSAAKLPSFLKAARTAAPEAEIVIVDNASDDDTIQVARQIDPRARIVQLAINLGFGRGCNLGAGEATGRWLLFTNPDLELRRIHLPSLDDDHEGLWSGTIATGAGSLSADQGIRADNSLPEDYANQVLSHLVPPSISSRIPVRRSPPGWASGALLLTSQEAFQRVGGFDSRYFLYYEDRDLGARYRALDIPIRTLNGLLGAHGQGTSSDGVSVLHRDAWSLISWFEYLGKWKGQPTANRAAKLAYRTFEPVASLSDKQRLSTRLRSKAERVDALLQYIRTFEERLPADADGYYPCARPAVEHAFSVRR